MRLVAGLFSVLALFTFVRCGSPGAEVFLQPGDLALIDIQLQG